MTAHSATIHGNKMIVFGGYQQKDANTTSSNDIWGLDLDSFSWQKIEVDSHIKPPPRYGQFQIYLDESNLLILGGCGGPNNMFSDAWTLNMATLKWKNVTITNKKFAATHMWYNPACKVPTFYSACT